MANELFAEIEKVCRDCRESKPLTDYSLGGNGKPRAYCKPCGSEAAMKWRDANPDKALDAHLRRTFGVTLEEFRKMEAEQGGVCAICGDPPTVQMGGKSRRQGRAVVPRLVVDHDHDTGQIRGLLCGLCNKGIGALGDDAATVQAAADYLRGAP